MNNLKSNIDTLYLIPFICGCKEINEAKNFIEQRTNIEIKIPNFTQKINFLIKEKYLILKNNPKKSKYNKKILSINKELIINEIINMLKDITNKFTYKFKIDGKKIIKKKRFSYDKNCEELNQLLKINKNKESFIKILGRYFEIILIVNSKDKINRKTKNFLLKEIIEQFFYGFALNKKFINEFHNYIDEEQIIIPNEKKIKLNEKLNELIKKISKDYKLIKEINNNSLYSSLLIK